MSSEHKPFLVVISAPSGCGKSTLIRGLLRRISGFKVSVSHTTRKTRLGEIDGVDYNFVDCQSFLQMVENREFIESATVHGNFYGTSFQSVESILGSGLDALLDIDVQGMELLRDDGRFDMVTIFILPPSFSELERRLVARKSDSQEAIKTRLANAVKEIDAYALYDYSIVNDDIESAVSKLAAILSAERLRTSRFLHLVNPTF